MSKPEGWHEIEGLASFAYSPPETEEIADEIYDQIRGEVARVNTEASDRVVESWRRHARDEYLREVYEHYPQRIIVGSGDMEPFLAEVNRIFLEAD